MSIQTTNQDNSLMSFTEEKVALLKQTICKGSTDNELELFIHACKKLGLDPFMRQIHAVKRGGVMTIQTGIDGYRLIAERSGKYMPGREPTYSYDKEGGLVSATAYVKKWGPDGSWHEIAATAFYDEFDAVNAMWKKMPHVMLAKCAEAAALRRAFPAEMSGVYTEEEMHQAENPVPVNRHTGEIELKPKISKSQEENLLALIGDDAEYKSRIFKHYNVNSFQGIDASEHKLLLERVTKYNEMRLEKEMNAMPDELPV